MRVLLFFALSLSAAPPLALAQADQSLSLPPATRPSLPLDAMRHHQPIAAQVRQREDQREGASARERQGGGEQSEIDRLYDDVMRRSAPVAESRATNSR